MSFLYPWSLELNVPSISWLLELWSQPPPPCPHFLKLILIIPHSSLSPKMEHNCFLYQANYFIAIYNLLNEESYIYIFSDPMAKTDFNGKGLNVIHCPCFLGKLETLTALLKEG